MELSKEDKNYYRVLLKDVLETKLEKPITLAGKYQHDNRFEYATFKNIRILLSHPYSKTRVICDHLNILKKDISRFYSLSEQDDKKRFYFVGYPVEYSTDGIARCGFRISEEVTFEPFGLMSERDGFQRKIDNECADLSFWIQDNITESDIGLFRKA